MINQVITSTGAKSPPKQTLPPQTPEANPSITSPQEVILTSGSKFTICTTSSGVLADSLYLNRNDWWKQALDKVSRFKRISHPIFVAGNPGFANYYHWTYQIWSSILFAKEERMSPESITVLGPPLNNLRRKHVELLGAGVEYIESEPDCAYFLDQAFWCDLQWGRYAFNPSQKLLDLHERFGSQFKRETPSKVYISRRDSQKRGVQNEDELEDSLKKRGFTSVTLSTLSAEDQIAIFAGAKFIVAPHGAGLTNIIFSSTRQKLIEIIPDDYFNQCFRAIASAKAFDYMGIVSPSTTDARGYHFSKVQADINQINLAIDTMEKSN